MLFMRNVVRKDQYTGYIQSLLERDDLELGECIDDYATESIQSYVTTDETLVLS